MIQRQRLLLVIRRDYLYVLIDCDKRVVGDYNVGTVVLV